ncbi:MAG: UDP-N-acetylmuramoyl-L-alanyl-D-glutamate--2,6-diaminopimelate ligase [Alphaproteobacteria bacterium]
MPRLTDLIRSADAGIGITGATDITIEHITSDSRQVKPGSLFVAIHGGNVNGLDYLPQAIKHGAAAVLCEHGDIPDAGGLTVLRAAEPRHALARLAAALYGEQPAHIVAVTGTDGKTSTADFSRQLMHQLGFSSASLGTIGITLGNGSLLQDASHTTPDPVELHRILAEMAGDGCTHLAMEASSHGLHQYRLDGVRLEAAAFTMLGRDHMDYHKDEADYFNAKARLFSELLPEGKTAVLNADDKVYTLLETICRQRGMHIIDYGTQAHEFRIKEILPHGNGQQVSCVMSGTPYLLDIPLAGAFQVMNILAAVGLAVGQGSKLEHVLTFLANLKGVPGRLERVVTLSNGAAVYIDYAHTPMALANILNSLRPHTHNALHVVFGCGGNRDKGKRPQMGKAAIELADHVIVTDDNPRNEDAGQIRKEVLAGAHGAQEVGDRRQAIRKALKALQSGDVLVIAGKGHEKTQTIGSELIPFHDGQVAKELAHEMELVDA